MGAGEQVRLHWREMAKCYLRHPTAFAIPAFLSFPLIASSLVFNTWVENSLLLFLLTLSLKFEILFPVFFLTGMGFLFLKNIAVSLLTYGVSLGVYYLASKKLNWEFSAKYFTIYYYLYSPIWFFVFMTMMVRGLISKNVKVLDWKIWFKYL